MVVALDGVVESVHAKVQHAVIRILILMYDLIHNTWLVMRGEVLRCYEMALVEVALAHAEKVEPHQQNHGCSHDGSPSFQYKRSIFSYSIHLWLSECP